MYDDMVTCPSCYYTDDINQFDIIGACGINVFCTMCHQEFNPDTGEKHEFSLENECCRVAIGADKFLDNNLQQRRD